MAEQPLERNQARPGEPSDTSTTKTSWGCSNPSPLEEFTSVDLGADSNLERVEVLAASAQNQNIEQEGLGEKLAELAVTTEEELDALRINLLQEDERAQTRDSSGRVVDDAAEERIASFTESDPMQGDLGAASVEPGRDNTSFLLCENQPNLSIDHSDAVFEGDLDESMDETAAPEQDEDTSG